MKRFGLWRKIRLLGGLAGALAVGAQGSDPELLQNAGRPMQVPFHCTREDIQSAGLACTADEPCPVYLELTSVDATGNRLWVAGNIHSETVTLYSVLLASNDEGATWSEPYRRIHASGLDRVQFTDLENGWATGESLSPLPQDPFLLVTADGGKTWRQHAIFSEPRVGSIQQIVFRSKSEGSLVFDRGAGTGQERYELHQSHDGGETWNFQEAHDRPVRLEEPIASGVWRIQADSKTQAFRIEHQAGNRWTSAAAFAVSLTSCAPPGENQ